MWHGGYIQLVLSLVTEWKKKWGKRYPYTEQRKKRVSNKMHITITTSRWGGKNRRTTTLGKGMLLTSVHVAQDKERCCKADRCHSSISQPTCSSRKPLVLYQAQERHTEKLAPRGNNVTISSCITAPRSIHTLKFPELCKIKLTSAYLPSLESCANLVGRKAAPGTAQRKSSMKNFRFADTAEPGSQAWDPHDYHHFIWIIF